MNMSNNTPKLGIETVTVYDGDKLLGVWKNYTVEAETWLFRQSTGNIEPAGNVYIRLSGVDHESK